MYAQYLAAIDSEFKHVIQFLCKPSGLERQTRSGASETGGIVGIIENIKQDLEEEISKAKDEEVRALCCSCVELNEVHGTARVTLDLRDSHLLALVALWLQCACSY